MEGLAARAAALGASDVFLLRRVAEGRYAHVGGVGRGAGWAGIVELDTAVDPTAAALLGDALVRLSWPEPQQVFGPYWACEVVSVLLSHDELVVYGAPSPSVALQAATAEELVALSREFDDRIDAVTPAKRLADELEVLHAVQDLAARRPATVEVAMQVVTEVAAGALSCEAALMWTYGREPVCHDAGWRPSGDVGPVLARLAAQTADLVCVQDAGEASLDAPLGPEHGVRSYLAVPVGVPPKALLLLVHTDARPRGFTSLCQRLGLRLGEIADVHLETTAVREEMQRALGEIAATARRDPLTGLGNRLAWEETCRRAQAELTTAAAAGYGIAVADLNSLKDCNDTYGHRAGDELLVSFARRIRSLLRAEDEAFRIGGDEIAVLIHAADAGEAAVVGERLRASLAAGGEAQQPLRAAVGHAWCPAGDSIELAMAAADEAMYAAKARERAALVPPPRRRRTD